MWLSVSTKGRCPALLNNALYFKKDLGVPVLERAFWHVPALVGYGEQASNICARAKKVGFAISYVPLG